MAESAEIGCTLFGMGYVLFSSPLRNGLSGLLPLCCIATVRVEGLGSS